MEETEKVIEYTEAELLAAVRSLVDEGIEIRMVPDIQTTVMLGLGAIVLTTGTWVALSTLNVFGKRAIKKMQEENASS